MGVSSNAIEALAIGRSDGQKHRRKSEVLLLRRERDNEGKRIWGVGAEDRIHIRICWVSNISKAVM